MPDYQLFGGILRSVLDFPELVSTTTESPAWCLTRQDVAAPLPDLLRLGMEDVDQGVSVTMFRSGATLRLVFSDTGIFDVSGDGRQIHWVPPPAPDMDAVRKDVLGRVFAVALDQAGIIALHGSAVALGSVAVAFLAPKFHGKSTTATALVNAGGRLLADDLVPVTHGAVPMVLPSVPVVQLWKDSAAQVAGSSEPLAIDQKSPKVQLAWKGHGRTANAAVPLGAVYFLAPMLPDAGVGVRRTRVTGPEAAVALLGQAKVGALLGGARRLQLLQRLADLAEVVPVYRLEIPRDFDRIGELTSGLLDWHAGRAAVDRAGGRE